MVIIKRVADDEYQLEAENGSVIESYKQVQMTHPRDWRPDAEAAGYTINGPYGWTFVDSRPERF